MSVRGVRTRRSCILRPATAPLLGVVALGVVACAVAESGSEPSRRADESATIVLVDDFESPAAGGAPASRWRHETFDDVPPTTYQVQRDAGGGYLRGHAVASGSLLTRSLDLDPVRFRHLRFRWRMTELPVAADVRRRSGDDCAMRLLVTFAYEPERATIGEKLARSLSARAARLPGSALCYIWSRVVEVGELLPNAFDAHTQMFVLESGETRRGEWIAVERDLIADYRRAFGHEPPRITGVAVMVDADQTRGSAIADIDDLGLWSGRAAGGGAGAR